MSIHYATRLTWVLVLLPSVLAAELVVSGVEPELERNIRAYVALADEPCDAEEWLLRRRYRSMEKEARKALEPFGYYEPTVSAKLTLGDECWHATLAVDPGEPVRLQTVDIAIRGEASTDPVFDKLNRPASLTSGAALRHADYEQLKRSLQVRAADRGYVEAEFTTSRLDIWPERRQADVTLHFDSGPRYRLGEIRQEQDFLDPAIVSAYLDLETGAYYDSQELARAYRDLSDSGYFRRIEVVPDAANADDGQIPVRVTLLPANRIEYAIGVGASTDTGPRFRLSFRNTRVNKKGNRFKANLAVSPVLQGLDAEYRRPLTDPRSDWMSYTGAVSQEETDTFLDDTARLGLRRSKRLNSSWIRTLALDVSYESFTVGNESDDSILVLPSLGYDHKFADKDLYPNRGRRLGVEFRGTNEILGSNTSFLQATAWARWIRAIGPRSRLIARGMIGATGRSEISELPPSVRFFAGGDESVRGYDFDSLGPKDVDGNVIGGDNLLTASIEYERLISGRFYGAVFVDAGNAFDGVKINPEVGTGLGLIWRSPVGPIKLYLAYPVTDDDPGVKVHLRLGADL